MDSALERVTHAALTSRLAAARRDSAVVEALLDGATQLEVSRAAGVSQAAVSQIVARRRTKTLGAAWTIAVLAGYLKEHSHLSTNEVVRACAQFSSDFRSLTDGIDREIALGAPEPTGDARRDALIAGLADYEAWRVGLPTPEWALSARYNGFPSWFLAPTDGLKAWVMRHTPPQFAVRGVYLDLADLESV
jgi:hypothetical protein